MPISKKWAPARNDYIKRNVPESKGVYELRSGGHLVYIGKTKNLRRRLLTHNRGKNPTKYRYKKSGFFSNRHKMEDQLLDAFEDKHGRLPSWNLADTRA